MKKYLAVAVILIILTGWYWQKSQPPAAHVRDEIVVHQEPGTAERSIARAEAPPAEKLPTKAPQGTSNQLVSTLEEILNSRNDNDPRLDTEFRNLSEADKQALRQKYNQLSAEDRNGKGTIVFLLGRELKNTADLDFFAQVMSEPPCLSLENCAKDEIAVGLESDGHADMGTETTLAYPQIMAMNWIEKFVAQDNLQDLPAEMHDALGKIISAAKASRHSIINNKAQKIDAKLMKLQPHSD